MHANQDGASYQGWLQLAMIAASYRQTIHLQTY